MSSQPKLFWLGLFLVASAWQFLLPLLIPPIYWLGILLVVAGALLNGFALADSAPRFSHRQMVAYALGALVVSALAPFPHRLGGFLLMAGLVVLWLVPSTSRASGFGMGVLLTGLMLTVISLCQPVLWRLACVLHQVGFMAPLVGVMFKLFGYPAHWESGTLFVQGSSGIQEYALATEYFGWMFVCPTLLGALIWQTLGPQAQRLRHFLWFVLGLLAYAIVRYVILGLLYLDLPAFPLFWSPWILCLSFLPLFLLLAAWPAAGSPSASASAKANRPEGSLWRKPFGLAGIAVGVALVVAAWGWEDPGHIKPARLLLDEAHSNWEKTNRPYDTEWYGEESGYNYYCLVQFLSHYYHLQHNSAKITDALLTQCDILLIKTPTLAFAAEEIDAIERFVRRGGGLFLIGDHTNVFGTSTYLNAIARRFGLHYNYDATYDLPTGGLSLYQRPRLLSHPIVQRLPPFMFGTSCTLDLPTGAAIPMQGYALRVAGHDYSATSFFSHQTDGPHIGFGLFPQLGAVKYYAGRVAAFTDSTVFSNFWMFLPGKPELMLGCTEWLNRQNRFSHGCLTLGILGVLLGIGGAFALRGRWCAQFPTLFAAGCLGFFGGIYLTKAANQAAYPAPSPHTHYPIICFERQYSRFELPAEALVHPPPEDFHTFFVWVQRVGYVPRTCPTLGEALKDAHGLVMLNPCGQLPNPALHALEDYVKQGGVLYVLDFTTNQTPAANQVLNIFGLRLANQVLTNQTIFNIAGDQVAVQSAIRVTSGGQGVLFTDKHEPCLSIAHAGNGAVVFSGDAELFANVSLGTTATIPDEMQRRLYEVAFGLFKQIESGPPQQPRD